MMLLNKLPTGRPLMIDPASVQGLPLMQAIPDAAERPEFLAAASGSEPYLDGYVEYHQEAGYAVIPLQGVMLNRLGYASPWAAGYDFLAMAARRLRADPDIKGVIFDIDSPGGMATGVFEAAEEIRQLSAEKPTLGVINGMSASAAYALTSAMGRVVASPSSSVGSIGVVATHMNFGKALDKAGIEVTYIYAGEHKIDGNPTMPLSKDVKTKIEDGVMRIYADFVSTVARNRGIDEKAVRDTEAQIYDADEALKLGLIDAVGSPRDAIAAFLDGLDSPANTEENSMTETSAGLEATPTAQTAEIVPEVTPEAAAPATAAPAGLTADEERARVKAILNCESAKDRTELANYLAFETDMSAEQAQKILAAAPVAVEKRSTGTVLDTLMDASPQPEVGADATPQELAAPDRIIRNFKLVTGR